MVSFLSKKNTITKHINKFQEERILNKVLTQYSIFFVKVTLIEERRRKVLLDFCTGSELTCRRGARKKENKTGQIEMLSQPGPLSRPEES
jgi:hypothetical protein